MQTGEDEQSASTLYCSGFPMDIRYREVRNLFQFCPGFEFARLVRGSKVPIAFATFDCHENALAAKALINGSFFEEDSNVDIRLEFAKSERRNQIMSRKRGRQGPEGDSDHRKTRITNKMTLLISGLGIDTSKGEIEKLVESIDGYTRFRWSPSKRQGGSPVAYVDFESDRTGLAALDSLAGQTLSTVHDGIQVKVAENAQVTSRRREFPGMPPFSSAPPPHHMGRRYPPDSYYSGPYSDMSSRSGRSGYGDPGFSDMRSYRDIASSYPGRASSYRDDYNPRSSRFFGR